MAWLSTIAPLRNGFDVEGRGTALPLPSTCPPAPTPAPAPFAPAAEAAAAALPFVCSLLSSACPLGTL